MSPAPATLFRGSARGHAPARRVTVPVLLADLRAAGVTVSLSPDGKIRCGCAGRLPAEVREAIAVNKPALLAYLRGEPDPVHATAGIDVARPVALRWATGHQEPWHFRELLPVGARWWRYADGDDEWKPLPCPDGPADGSLPVSNQSASLSLHKEIR